MGLLSLVIGEHVRVAMAISGFARQLSLALQGGAVSASGFSLQYTLASSGSAGGCRLIVAAQL